jgi:hypothetical protein
MILDILNTLESDSSRNFKINLLKTHKNNFTLRRVMELALDPFVTFYIKNIPDFQYNPRSIDLESLDWALDQLFCIIKRQVTGHAAIEFLGDILNKISESDGEVIKRVVSKDLRCGVAESTVNTIWPGLVHTFDVCLAHKDISHIKYPAYAQVKMDGARCHLSFDGETATAYSRNGKTFNVHGAFNQPAKVLIEPGEVWDGEILFFDQSGKILDRKTSNGLANKALKNTLTKQESERAVFVVWDIVDFTGQIDYSTRWNRLERRMERDKSGNLPIKLVHSKIVNDHVEGELFYNECIAAGEEGAILKNCNFKWQPKRVKGVGKIKACEEADLIVTGWEKGTGKNHDRIGALICETRDHLLKVNVGSGLSDDFRTQSPENIVGKIVTVTYNQIITSDGKKTTKSLFLPRFKCVRLDKDFANSLKELK